MCGRFNLIDSPQVQLLCALLGVPMPTHNFRADIAPGGPIAIVLERRNAEGQKSRQVSEATWWLLLDPQAWRQTTNTQVSTLAQTSLICRVRLPTRRFENRAASFRQAPSWKD
jgi:putative SOS response-associated peptidase YedK